MNPHQKPQEDVVGLLPCPFCGGEAELHQHIIHSLGHERGAYYYTCSVCPARTSDGAHQWFAPLGSVTDNAMREQALTAWNTRSTPTYEAGRRDMREAAGKVAQDEADDIERHQPSARDSWQQGRAAMAKSIATSIQALPTEPLGGEQP